MKDTCKGKHNDSYSKSDDADKAQKKKIKCWYSKIMGNTTKDYTKKKDDLRWKKEGKGNDNPKSDSANS